MLKNIILAFLFVLPLYWVWLFEFIFQIDIPLFINSIFGLLSLYIFLFIPKAFKFKFGFFVGLFWFYWVGFSFVYFGFGYLVPFISVIVACIYIVIFSLALWFQNPIYRLGSLLVLSFIHPFTFDWMNIDSFFAYSFFGVSKRDIFLLALTLITLQIASKHTKKLYLVAGLLLCLSFKLPSPHHNLPALKIDLLHTNFSQDQKWQRDNIHNITTKQIQMIRSSIQEGHKLIILPETAFPFVLEHSFYLQLLKDLSRQNTLVVGSMRKQDSMLFNSTYVFQNGNVQIFDKVVLAPFGEKIPLPDFLSKPLSKIFLDDGAPQFSESKKFGSFFEGGVKFKSVICYEGTSKLAYEDFPQFLIVISNNAWFPHSIEPALQKNLMKYYAKLYQTTILHSSNGSPSFVIFP